MSIPCPPPPQESDDDSCCSQGKKIRIGVCAMKKKATSKPMRTIMGKIVEYYKDWLEYFIFPEEVILNEPVERWPLCDCLISFHSTDFPLYKAIEYENLRKPYVINDLKRQYDLLDRRKVFRTLAKAGIEHPRHGVVIRDGSVGVGKPKSVEGDSSGPEGHLDEHADHIEVNGMVFNKPFVEKPISAEDHNVYIYYPSSAGGGSQRLFRKINNRSSWYSPSSEVRKEGSYIYEDFIPADGTDVKVYAVGPYYAHAEARKAPGLDGKVERDADGKEVRFPVILSHKEKAIARRVVLAFGLVVSDQRFIQLFKKYDGLRKNELKMKKPNQLMEVLELAREILHEKQQERNDLLKELEQEEDNEKSAQVEHGLELVEETLKKWEQMRTVLEMCGEISGTRGALTLCSSIARPELPQSTKIEA